MNGRYILTRIIIGVAIGLCMLIARKASAAETDAPGTLMCPSGKGLKYKVTSTAASANRIGLSSPPAVGSYYNSTDAIKTAAGAYAQTNQPCVSGSTDAKWSTPYLNGATGTTPSAESDCNYSNGANSGYALVSTKAVCVDLPACTPTTINDPAAYTGYRDYDGDRPATMCDENNCQIASFPGDDWNCIGVSVGSGSNSYTTTCGTPTTRWRIVGSCAANQITSKADADVAEKCSTVQGQTVCRGGPTTPKNCIKINGNLSCTSDAGNVCTDSSCNYQAKVIKNSDGTATGVADTPTPPSPNTGVAGILAQADLIYRQFVTGFGGGSTTTTAGGRDTNYNHYSSTVVANSYNGDGSVGGRNVQSGVGSSSGGTSSSSGASSGASSGGGSSGSGQGSQTPSTNQTDEGNCTKPDPDDCNGAAGAIPGIPSARTFGESLSTITNAFNGSPLATQVHALSIPAGGTCPAPTIQLPYLHSSVTMDAQCQLGTSIGPTLRSIFLALWVIVAIAVFLRA